MSSSDTVTLFDAEHEVVTLPNELPGDWVKSGDATEKRSSAISHWSNCVQVLEVSDDSSSEARQQADQQTKSNYHSTPAGAVPLYTDDDNSNKYISRRKIRFHQLEADRDGEIAQVASQLELELRSHYSDMQSQLQQSQQLIDQWKTSIQPENLAKFDREMFDHVSKQLTELFNQRQVVIDAFSETHGRLERKRKDDIVAIFRKYQTLMTRSFYQTPAKVEEILELQSVRINEQIINNIRNMDDMKMDLIKAEALQEDRLKRLLNTRQTVWKQMTLEKEIDIINRVINEAAVAALQKSELHRLHSEMTAVWRHHALHFESIATGFGHDISLTTLETWKKESLQILTSMDNMFVVYCRTFLDSCNQLQSNMWTSLVISTGVDLAKRGVMDESEWRQVVKTKALGWIQPVVDQTMSSVNKAIARWSDAVQLTIEHVNRLYSLLYPVCQRYSTHLNSRHKLDQQMNTRLELVTRSLSDKSKAIEKKLIQCRERIMKEVRIKELHQIQSEMDQTLGPLRLQLDKAREQHAMLLKLYSDRLDDIRHETTSDIEQRLQLLLAVRKLNVDIFGARHVQQEPCDGTNLNGSEHISGSNNNNNSSSRNDKICNSDKNGEHNPVASVNASNEKSDDNRQDEAKGALEIDSEQQQPVDCNRTMNGCSKRPSQHSAELQDVDPGSDQSTRPVRDKTDHTHSQDRTDGNEARNRQHKSARETQSTVKGDALDNEEESGVHDQYAGGERRLSLFSSEEVTRAMDFYIESVGVCIDSTLVECARNIHLFLKQKKSLEESSHSEKITGLKTKFQKELDKIFEKSAISITTLRNSVHNPRVEELQQLSRIETGLTAKTQHLVQSAQEQCAAEIAWLAARLDALRQQQQTEQQSATQQTRRAYQLLALIGQQERRHRQLATAAQQRGEALRCQLQSQLEALVQEYDADGAAAERYGGRLMKLSWPEAATADSRDPVTMASAGGGAGGSGGVKEPTLTATATPPTVPKVNRSATTASQPWPDQAAAGASGGSGGRVAGGAQGTVSLTHKPSNAVAAAALHRRRQLDSAHHATRSCLKRLGQQREQLLRRMETVTAAVLANLNGQMQDLQLAERIQCGVAALRSTLRALCLQAVAELRRTHQAIVQLQQQGQQQQQQQQGEQQQQQGEQQQQQQQQGEQQQQQQQQRGEQGKQQEEEGTRQVEAVFDEVNRVAALIRHCSDYLCNDGGAPLQLSEATVGHISSVCQPAEQQPQSRAAAGSSSLSTVVDNTASGGGGGELSRLATPSAQPAGRSSTVSRCVSRELRDAPPLDSYLQLTRKSDASAKLCETSAAAAAGINEARLPAWCDLCAAFQRTSTAIAADRDTDSRNWPLPLAASRRKFDRDDTLAEALKPLGSPDDPADEGNTICLVKQTAEGNASSVVVTANTAAGRPATKAPAAAAAAKSTHNQNRRRRNNNNSNNNSEPAAAATITATTSQYRGLHRLSNQQLLSKLFPGESERGVSEADETGAAATTAAAAAAVVVVADTFMSSVRRHIGASLLQLKDIAAEYYCKQKRKAPTRTDILPVSLHHLLEVVLLRLRSLYHHCRHFDLAAVQLLSSCYDDYLQTVAAVPHELVGGSAGRCTDRLVAISVDTAGRLHRLQTVWHKQVTALHQQLRPALPLARLRQLHQLAADSCDQLQRQLHQLRQMYTKRLAATALAYSTVSDRLAQRYSASSRCITVGWPSEQLASEQLQQQLLAQLTRCVDSALHYSGTQWQQHRQLVDHQFEQHYRRIDQRRVQSLAAWTRDLGKIHKLFSTEPSTNIAG